MKHKDCNWCGEKLFKNREHECPKIFIYEINQKGKLIEYKIRGEITLEWKNRRIIISEKKRLFGDNA